MYVSSWMFEGLESSYNKKNYEILQNVRKFSVYVCWFVYVCVYVCVCVCVHTFLITIIHPAKWKYVMIIELKKLRLHFAVPL